MTRGSNGLLTQNGRRRIVYARAVVVCGVICTVVQRHSGINRTRLVWRPTFWVSVFFSLMKERAGGGEGGRGV